MMVYGVRKMKRWSAGCVVHVSKWRLWRMDEEGLMLQRVRGADDGGAGALYGGEADVGS